jgi:hypothetical protein
MKLIELDMSKADKHYHPDIKMDTYYLIKNGGIFYAGVFQSVWYGYSFRSGIMHRQFDAPGSNSSAWQGVWEIVE